MRPYVINKELYWRITKSVGEETTFVTNHINQNQYKYSENFKTETKKSTQLYIEIKLKGNLYCQLSYNKTN